MKITESMLRSLIRETLLSEEAFGTDEIFENVDNPPDVKQHENPPIETVESGNWVKFKTPYGEIDTHIADGAMTVREAMVKESYRGQGLGVALYSKALAYAQDRGLRFQSSSLVSVDADRVWQALQRRGAPVRRAAHAKLDTSFPGGGKWAAVENFRGIDIRTEEPLWST